VSHRRLDRVKCKVICSICHDLFIDTTINFTKYLINKFIPIKIKPLKKRNNEIIIQYLTDPTVTKDEPSRPLCDLWACPRMSDQMSPSYRPQLRFGLQSLGLAQKETLLLLMI
jgi:hypothetical protein